jgi:hypothetical protein
MLAKGSRYDAQKAKRCRTAHASHASSETNSCIPSWWHGVWALDGLTSLRLITATSVSHTGRGSDRMTQLLGYFK